MAVQHTCAGGVQGYRQLPWLRTWLIGASAHDASHSSAVCYIRQVSCASYNTALLQALRPAGSCQQAKTTDLRRYAAISTASLSVTLTASSTAAEAKLAVSLLSPTPSVIVSKGFFNRLPSASCQVYSTPRFTCTHNAGQAVSCLHGYSVPWPSRACQRAAASTRHPAAAPFVTGCVRCCLHAHTAAPIWTMAVLS